MPATQLFARLARAIDDGDAELVAELVERHGYFLVRTDASLLASAIRIVPADVIDRHPGVALVQEVFAPITPAVTARDDALLEQAIGTYRGLDDHGARVGVGLAAMIGLTRRGRFTEAAALGSQLTALGLELLDPGYSEGASVAALDLHAGIAHLMAADLVGAERHLSAAYRGISPFANHRLDAAGKLGFLYAMRGESHLAGTWLDRARSHEEAAGDWWLRSTERQSIAAANMLLAVDRLDWPGFHRHNLAEDMSVPSENWMYVLYARARAGLFLGNQRILVEELHDFREQVPLIFSPGSLPQMLLDTAELDLLVSLGDLEAAGEVFGRLGDDPTERTAAARFRLMTGDAAGAEQIAAETRWPVRISRRDRLNLLLLRVTADLSLRLQSEERIRLLRQAAVETANEVDPWLYTMAVSDPATVDLFGRYAPDARQLLARLAEIDPPRPFRLTAAPARLTPRELVLLERLAGAGAISDIAAALHVSPATVRNQRKSLYRKLGATSRAHAVEIALRNGLLPGDPQS